MREMRGPAGVGLVLLLAALPRVAWAAELPDAVVRVNRGPGAESCPREAELVGAVVAQARVPAQERGASKPTVDVDLERYGDVHFATIRVDGGLRGVRTLQSESATCDALRDAVVLALLVLLERDAALVAPPPEALAPPAAPSAARPSAFLGAGAAVTFGEPSGVLPAILGDASVSIGAWAAGAGFQWSPPSRIDSGPGRVVVDAWGFTLRLCRAIASTQTLRLSGCGLGSVLVLSGEGEDLDDGQRHTRPWWRAGAGIEAAVPLTARLSLAAIANGFATLHEETFSVGGLGERYETSAVTGHLGMELRVRLF